jgi:hypothetical protein
VIVLINNINHLVLVHERLKVVHEGAVNFVGSKSRLPCGMFAGS